MHGIWLYFKAVAGGVGFLYTILHGDWLDFQADAGGEGFLYTNFVGSICMLFTNSFGVDAMQSTNFVAVLQGLVVLLLLGSLDIAGVTGLTGFVDAILQDCCWLLV